MAKSNPKKLLRILNSEGLEGEVSQLFYNEVSNL